MSSPWEKFVRQFVKPGSLVFDIGAHGGNYTMNYLLMGAHVVAVEPQAAILGMLVSRCIADKRVKIENLTALCLACGPKAGEGTLTIYDRCGLASLAPEKWAASRMRTHEPGGECTVDVVTLDDLIRMYGVPDFIKIDVEYYEPEVFEGLSRPVPALCYEYTREQIDDSTQIALYLQSLGSYEFAYGLERDPPKSEWSGDVGAMFAELDVIEDGGLWGDMYARLRND